MSISFYTVYKKLFAAYGEQHWWPGNSVFEIMVGAVLTQNTSWKNVEVAIANIKQHRILNSRKLAVMPQRQLAKLVRPTGYFNIKARRLQSFCTWYNEAGQYKKLNKLDTHALRQRLLAVHGIGPETADDILLYAFERDVFVIDAYTRRLFQRLGLITGKEGYEHLRQLFETRLRRLPDKVQLFNEYHALIVYHAKYTCLARNPRCSDCCLARICAAVQ